MRLFIRLKDGKPFEHPILERNLRMAFPSVDPNNLPDWLAEFKRVPRPEVGVYDVYEGVRYEFDGPMVTDVHTVRPMTLEEKTQKQDEIRAAWSENGFSSWVFDAEGGYFKPPLPYPDDGNIYRWDDESVSWVLEPQDL